MNLIVLKIQKKLKFMQINPKILISLQGHFAFVLGLLKNIKTQTSIYCGLGLISIFRKNPYVIDIYI